MDRKYSPRSNLGPILQPKHGPIINEPLSLVAWEQPPARPIMQPEKPKQERPVSPLKWGVRLQKAQTGPRV